MKKGIKTLSALILVVAMLFCLGSCGKKTDQIYIVYLVLEMDNPTIIECMNAAKEYSDSIGVRFEYASFDGDVNKLVTLVENYVNAGVDGLICQLAAAEDALDAFKAAREKGVFIIYDNGETNENTPQHYAFGANNYDLGYAIGVQAATWANENIPADVDIIVGISNYRLMAITIEREEGIRAGLADTCPRAKIVMDGQGGSVVEGVTLGENFLQAYPDMNLVVCIGDGGALGVYEAFTAAGKGESNIGIFGCDASTDALTAILEGGIFKGSVYLDITSAMKLEVQYIVDAVNGKFHEPAEVYYTPVPVDIKNAADFA